MISRLKAYAERLRDEEAAARGDALRLLRLPDPALAKPMATSRSRTAATPSERRHAARVVELVEACLARPDTATRWADTSGRWDGSPAQRVQALPLPWWIMLLLKLAGSMSQASSSHTGA